MILTKASRGQSRILGVLLEGENSLWRIMRAIRYKELKGNMPENNKNIIIPGIVIKPLKKLSDNRGWLLECFRQDEIGKELLPVMSYISMTKPGVTRGPHEHLHQTDYFCFSGPSNFKINLWDNRKDSKAYRQKAEIRAGEDNPMVIIVPPGVVHAYKNIGKKEGLIINFPNKLYAGCHKKEKVDEVRYENDPNTPYKVEE